MVFATPGIKVILARSNESDVVLSVNKASAGVYRCQVTVEGSFRSIKAEKRMEVVESAPWNKLITGSRLGAGALGQNRQQQQRHTVHQQSQHYGVINNNNIASSSFRGQQQHQKHARPGASSGANGAPAGEPVWVPIQLLLYISMSLMTNVAISASVWRLAASY